MAKKKKIPTLSSISGFFPFSAFSDIRPHVNTVNLSKNSSVLLAATLNHWAVLKFLLETPRLRNPETEESCVDVHQANEAGHTAIVQLILARIKLARLEQTHTMKKERSLAARAKAEHDLLWDMVKLILAREKEIHGPTMVQGRDGGNACLKKQLAAHKLIRSPTPDTITSEFTKLYNVLLQKKKSTGAKTQMATTRYVLVHVSYSAWYLPNFCLRHQIVP